MDTDIKKLLEGKLSGSNFVWYKIGAAVIPVIISGTVAWTTLSNTVDSTKAKVEETKLQLEVKSAAIKSEVEKVKDEQQAIKTEQAVSKERFDAILKALEKIDKKLDQKKDK